MLKSDKRVIDGHTWALVQMPATPSLRVLHRITKAIGPALVKGFEALGKSNLLKADTDYDKLSEAVSMLFDSCGEDDLDKIVKLLLDMESPQGRVLLDGKPITPERYELVFAGAGLATLIKVVRFALEVNYGDFFGGTGGLLSGLLRPTSTTAGTSSSTSSTSDGPTS